MKRLQLIHWNAAEATERAARLAAAGYEVASGRFNGPESLKLLKVSPPAAVVIDLSRQPSHGLAVALALRKLKATRRIPLVFVWGEEEKVARVRQQLPDAGYTQWSRIRAAVARAIAHPPPSPVVPRSVFAPYAGRPLAAKLGIKPDTVVSLVGAPRDFAATLGALPAGVRLTTRLEPASALTVCFVRSKKELGGAARRIAGQLTQGSVWMAWPKKTSGVATDLGEQVVRETGLAAGLVDYKICAIDATWSGLCFTRRKAARR